MLDALLLKLLSIALSILLVTVPREEYERQLDAIPPLDKRAENVSLRGWTYERLPSSKRNITHFYYHLPGPTPHSPMMVMLHGFNTNGRAFQNLAPLSDTFELIAYNFPESSSLYHGSIDDFSVILDDFFEALAVDSVILVANSLGGPIAMRYLNSHPRVTATKVIFISSFAGGATAGERLRNRFIAERLDKLPDYRLLYLVQKFTAAVHKLGTMGIGEDFPRDIVVIKRVDWYRQVVRCLSTLDGRDDARQIRQPVLVLHGLSDKVVSPEMGAHLAQSISQSNLEIFEGKGHAMVNTDAGLVVDRIREWLSEEASEMGRDQRSVEPGRNEAS